MVSVAFRSGWWSVNSLFSTCAIAGGVVRLPQVWGSYGGNSDSFFGRFIQSVWSAFRIRSRFRPVDYKNFRKRLEMSGNGRIHNLGGYTFLFDGCNRLIAIKRAARFDFNGRCLPPHYYVRAAD